MGIRRQFAVARQFSEVGVYGGYHEVYCCAKAVQAVGDHRPKKRIQQILLNPFFCYSYADENLHGFCHHFGHFGNHAFQ